MSDGSRAEAVLALQSNSPVSVNGSNVKGPTYHQIRPNRNPHGTPSPKPGDSLRNNKPNVIPIAALTIKCTTSPRSPAKLVSRPAIFGNMPVANMTGLE